MKKSLAPFMLAPLALLLSLNGAHAMTLGEVQLKSFLGQRFKADIPFRLNGEERLLEDCYQIRPVSSDVAYIGATSIQLLPRGDGSSGILRVTSGSLAEEPIMGFALNIECDGVSLTREFTVFLDPPPVIEAPVTSQKKTSFLTEAAPAAKKIPSLITQQETTLERIAGRYFPASSPLYSRYLTRLKRSNPELVDAEIPAGSEVYLPPRPVAKKPAAKVVHPQLAATQTTPPAPASSGQEQGRLRLEGADSQIVSPPPASLQNNPEAYIKELENKIAELGQLRQRLQLEIEALDRRMALNAQAMNTVASAAQTAVVTSAPLLASPVASVTVVPAPVVKEGDASSVKRTVAQTSNWQWPLVIGLFGLGAGIWWWRRNGDQESSDEHVPSSVLSALKTSYAPRPASPATEQSLMKQLNTGIEVRDVEANSLDQAQYYMAHGDTLRAIEMMQQLIEADPQDVERWLMLFRVYRQQGMKSDYVQLAKKFRAQTPPLDEDDWELVRSIGYKLDPEHPLFAKAVKPQERVVDEIDVELQGLAEAGRPFGLKAESTSTNQAKQGEASEVDLLQAFQAPVHPRAAHKTAAPLRDEIEPDLTIPASHVLNDQVELSPLDELEFDVKEIRFDDDKKPD
ncbi:FimV family protein [Chitinibacter sp. S2-10]|uniref:type IV pilus assembly protein FimV n=1 Tax=Chitinibacter sp. S2-10 TaxID=3373597 RepID=UPI0039776A79